jgi:hypothetical protein
MGRTEQQRVVGKWLKRENRRKMNMRRIHTIEDYLKDEKKWKERI